MTITIPQLQGHLAKVQDAFCHSECIIAGGAVRDTLNGRPVKDIDVFIDLNQGPGEGMDNLIAKLHMPQLTPHWVNDDQVGYGGRTGSGYMAEDVDGAFLVCDLDWRLDGCPTQFIFLAESPVANVRKTFDFDISQAWVTRHRVWTTDACKRAMLSKRITYCPGTPPNNQQRQSSRDRLERLREKYAGWSFNCIIPKDL